MSELIDITLLSDAKRCFHKLLARRGINYFLRQDGAPFTIEPAKVEMVLRTATKARAAHLPRPHAQTIERARKEIRRELIRRVVQVMLNVGL